MLKGFLTNPGVFIEAILDWDINKFRILVTRLSENAICNPIAEHLFDLGMEIIPKYQNHSDSVTLKIPTLPELLKQLLESWYVSLY